MLFLTSNNPIFDIDTYDLGFKVIAFLYNLIASFVLLRYTRAMALLLYRAGLGLILIAFSKHLRDKSYLESSIRRRPLLFIAST